MKTLSIAMLLGLIVIGSHGQTLTEAERSKAIAYLESTRSDLLLATKGLSNAQLDFKSDSSRWSIRQCVEHITLAEIGLSQMLAESLKAKADPSRRSEIKVSDDEVIQRLTNRKGKASAPEFLKPTGKFPTPAQALAKFADLRGTTNEFVKTTSDDLHNHYAFHPVTGTIDAYQLILLMAAHGKRHTLQIEEVKSYPAFPKE